MKRTFLLPIPRGFTMAETLLIVAFVGLLMLVGLFNAKRQIIRGYDGIRKADLSRIRRAFEEYNTDHGCYPPTDVLDNCGGNQLYPYLEKIPCDPTTRTSYLYVAETGDPCKGYRACTALGDVSDPDIANMGCNPYTGCGWGMGYNYCMTSGVSVLAPGFDPSAGTPTPTSTPVPTLPPPGPYACAKGIVVGGIVVVPGTCNNFGDPLAVGCPMSFANDQCLNLCPTNTYTWCP